ncbi:hypothetical protein NQ314_014765 [Rhamnusium bicolor]|uniref:Large ribosomal subunit protein uL10-like insertion domain-containing protein n=1 Tax=Rhamnusium bicolor TaxID=1586634 RepID=A0AAV8X1K4_9CUCU|nr:hypothetical protein NQ314_014765 [Rhamnusium bicolor]
MPKKKRDKRVSLTKLARKGLSGKQKTVLDLKEYVEKYTSIYMFTLGRELKGQCGLLFTDTPNEEVMEWFSNFSVDEFARSGFKVNKTIKLDEGPLPQFPHAMEPYLREKLGLPTKLDKGVVTLIKDFEVCKSGNVLTPEQARILELFDHKLATFKLRLKAKWTKLEGFEKLAEQDEEDEEGEDDDGMDADD